MPATLRASASFNQFNTDIIIPTIVAGDTVVYLGLSSDGDPVHRQLTSVTVGGVTMTAAPGVTTAAAQNNQADVYILANAAGGTNVVLRTNYNGGIPGFFAAWYTVQGALTTQAGANTGSASSVGSTTPSIALTATTNDLILEAIASSATPTATGGQTVDFTGSGNGSSFAIARKAAASGTNTESYSQSLATFAIAGVVVQGTSSGGAPALKNLMMLGVGI